MLAETHRTGRLRDVVHNGGRHPRKVRLDAPEISRELAALAAQADDPAYPLRLIGLRELRSHNSWMHNAPTLMKGKRSHADADPPQGRRRPRDRGRPERAPWRRATARSRCPQW